MSEIEEIFADCNLEEDTFQEPGKREFLITQVDTGKAPWKDAVDGKTVTKEYRPSH